MSENKAGRIDALGGFGGAMYHPSYMIPRWSCVDDAQGNIHFWRTTGVHVRHLEQASAHLLLL